MLLSDLDQRGVVAIIVTSLLAVIVIFCFTLLSVFLVAGCKTILGNRNIIFVKSTWFGQLTIVKCAQFQVDSKIHYSWTNSKFISGLFLKKAIIRIHRIGEGLLLVNV